MDWANEQYILVYIRDSGDWLMWSWQTRAVMLFLLRKVNRAGILDLGKGKLRALAKILEMPELELSEAIAPLLEDGCVQIHEEKLIIPNFIPAQEAKHSDKARKQKSRETERARLLSQPVTRGHTESHEVTLPYPTQSNPSESNSDARASVTEEEPEEVTGVRHVSSRPPPPSEPSEATAPPVTAGRPSAATPSEPGAVASGDLAAYIRGKPKLADLDVDDLADFASRMHDPGNVPLGMIREAIDDANDKSERGEARHIRHARVIGFVKQAKTKPRKPDPKPPALVDDVDPAAVARIQRMPKRVTAQSVPLVGAGREAALEAMSKLVNGSGGLQAPPGPTSDAELDARRLDGKRRLAEANLDAKEKAG